MYVAEAVSIRNKLFWMDIFAQRLRERAKRLGISNAEAARRIGLEERRYAHYAAGRREPDLITLKRIAKGLQTTPNWLLGVASVTDEQPKKAALIERFVNAAASMSKEQLELTVVQAEAVAATNG